MTAQQLKNSILQLAVQGKLVPQDPNDEPASVLLERIRKEKEALIKAKKIKKEKNPSVIFRGADNTPYEKIGNEVVPLDVPFDIPDSWEWVRLGNIVNIVSARRVHQSDWKSTGIPFYRAREIGKLAEQGFVNNELYISEELYNEYKESGVPRPGDLMVTAVGTLGKTYIVKPEDKFYYKDASVVCFENYGRIVPEYLKLLMASPYMMNQITDNSAGTTVGTITIVNANNYLIPLPPICEQNRIVAFFDTLLPCIQSYEQKQTALENLNFSFPNELKKSILQWAVQGKLVHQNESDEPAEVLLNRIRAEKETLIKAGKIKRDKHESVIFRRDNSHYEKCGHEEVCIDDEIPFEVPKTWGWIRLNDIGEYRKGPFGSSLTKGMFVPKSENSIKVYEQKNAIKKDHTLGSYYITKEYYNRAMSGFTVLPGDIIVSCAGTIGETYILPDDIELGIINQALMRMRIYAPISIEFFLLYFDYVLKETAKEGSKGSAIKNIPPFEIFKKLLLPIPPLDEQKRIVEKVAMLSEICDNMSK